MKIGIFGGSFNPVHKGHLLVANYAIKTLGLDKLIFVPTYQNPFKNKRNEIDPIHKVKMLELVLQDKYEISKFEINRQAISYTIDSAKYFRAKYPHDEIFWLIGSDNLKKLNKWKNIDQIASLVQLTVFKRSSKINQTNIKKYNAILLNNPLFVFSANSYKHGSLDFVDVKTQTYIGQNHLYLKDFMTNFLTPLRYKHSLATAELAVKYAKQFNYDHKKAYLGGLLHDLTKNWPIDKHEDLLHELNVLHHDYQSYALHGLTASLWLEKKYLLNDSDITQAIAVHTTLAHELSTLDKIVYAADKLCKGRKWVNIQKLRNLMNKDFDEGFRQLVKFFYQRFKNEGKQMSAKQIAIYEKWIK